MAEVWFEGWHFAHDAILPAGLVAARTRESFRERLGRALDRTLVGRIDGRAVALAIVDGDELHQFFVDRLGRGTGIASALMREVRERFEREGIDRPWLDCACGNDRARRFYEREGWRVASVETDMLGPEGNRHAVEVWRMTLDPNVATELDRIGQAR